MLTRRMLAVITNVAAALCGCVPSHYSPVPACPALADGTHPSSGSLEVLPSEVPDVQLDSMRWYAHTGHEGEEFGTWTSVGARGRIVSTKETSLVGVGVLVEGMRGTTVVHRMIDSSFYEFRQLPWFAQGYTLITRETVRPDRPVPVEVGEKNLSDTPPARWGCPTRARLVRISAPGAVLRAPRPPEDERTSSDFYAWSPSTFSVDTIMMQRGGEFALLRGAYGDTARTDVIIVQSKILYRRLEPGGIRADSSRIKRDEFLMLARQRGPAEAHAAAYGMIRDPSTPTPTPDRGESILMLRSAGPRYELRFPTASPPPELAPIVQTISLIGDRIAPTASRDTPKP